MVSTFSKFRLPFFSLFLLIATATAWADPTYVRWVAKDDANGELTHVLDVLRSKTGYELKAEDFLVLEDRDLANNHFKMLAQTASQVPISGASIRIWTELGSMKVVQVEAFVEQPQTVRELEGKMNRIQRQGSFSRIAGPRLMSLVRATVQKHPDDRAIRSVDWSLQWKGGELVRIAKVKGKHGTHLITVSAEKNTVLGSEYQEFPQDDFRNAFNDHEDEFTLFGEVFPIYEEVESTGELQPRATKQLKYLKKQVARVSNDPFAALRTQRYLESTYDPLLGMTELGRAQGYWSPGYIRDQAEKIRLSLPLVENDPEKPAGAYLEGRYATISLHPDVKDKFKGLQFVPAMAAQYKPQWKSVNVDGKEQEEMIPMGSLFGRPLTSSHDAWLRPARRLADHDPVGYINDGFDELQVYYSINQLFDSLKSMGWTDPELSTRPFHAFLYDPDIAYRDNAYYTDDTINFTTYSPKSPNMARDNPTIWHELGHGVMDRLMGDYIRLADTGGLSEGMADFVAQLVINDVTEGKPFPGSEEFRIKNKTGFLLTNEVHDDGEAYGGAMNDLLEAAMAKWGAQGLRKVTDVTLEAMRLTRNHPALTAQDWFSHMLFADELGNGKVRASGELRETILGALAGRNFNLDGREPAKFVVKNGDEELTSKTPGSRGNPIRLTMSADEKQSYELAVNLKNSDSYQFRFPVQIRVYYRKGALQGAIRWDGEEAEPQVYTLNSEADLAQVKVTANGTCDFVNREDGSCVDYAYIQVWNNGETQKPVAKKRFYLRVNTKKAQ